ncbi:MAG: PQQ-binding-like beta-propeller repeat protein [Kiritimatiellia bacterium]|jgi:outer membrane protein assembly factor BamB|nr:PQQ-binding-like beta-propeller repeat protein [Kiritimatiellia bacterium]MDP6809574.1 PQQ-binding-like beta-propeller repeat protein [Kiritimatiellia bacterium]MDP7023575.1 PQQ-binding-like beta-propeller repeat protein [Kiritimatiellia bacterium]
MRTVSVALAAFLVGVTAHAADWPVFRGDAGLTGVAQGNVTLPLKLLWRVETGNDVRATPVIGDGVVYVGSTDGKLYALDQVKGTPRWVYEAADSIEGAALLVSNLVVVGDLEGVLHALDAKSGAKRWTLKVADRIIGAPNRIDAVTPPRIVFGSYDNKLRCVSLTGKPAWEFETESYINGAPAVVGDRVMTAGCDANLYVLRARDGSLLKSVEVGSYVAASPAAIGGYAVVGDYDGNLTAVDLTSHQVAWTYDGGDGAPFFSSPAGSGSLVIAGGRDGRVHAVNAGDGARRWTFKTGGDVDSSPVICDGKVLFGSRDGRLYAVGLADGKELWSYEIGAAIVGSPAVANGGVVIGAEDGAVYAFGRGAAAREPASAARRRGRRREE